MSPQTGSIVLYCCAVAMGVLGWNRYNTGDRGRAVRNFVMAALMALFGFVFSLSAG